MLGLVYQKKTHNFPLFHPIATPKGKKESSSSESSDDSDDEPAKKTPAPKAPITNGKAKVNSKSSSSSEESDDSDEGVATKKAKIVPLVVKKKGSSSSDSSDSDSDDKQKPAIKTPAKLGPIKTSTPNNFKPVKFVSGGFAQPTIKKTESSSSDDSDSDEKPAEQNNSTVTVGKKRKFSENGDSPAAKKANTTDNSFNKSSNSKPNTPFRRVKTEDVSVDERLANNSFDAKVSGLQTIVNGP